MVQTQIKNRVKPLKMIVRTNRKGYFGMPKGMSKAPQMVLMVDNAKANKATHKYMPTWFFSLSYSTPINPKAIINYNKKKITSMNSTAHDTAARH